MNAHAVPYPSLRRRLISQRRSRALFLSPATQHVRSGGWLLELARAALALGSILAWGSLLFILGA
jgi:hypothetical protein